ncbi:hypothetical protein GQ607_003380 [Colletotrichum asianum]|uniref:Uncharacterized protein n=1 Tax=Colletotrichum asianum TaxID=702518 RepID=A0A8H3WIQ6_9PEZI|nr:hypothetical protein GQ607_003380 [Colletotrichum asianum]
MIFLVNDMLVTENLQLMQDSALLLGPYFGTWEMAGKFILSLTLVIVASIIVVFIATIVVVVAAVVAIATAINVFNRSN